MTPLDKFREQVKIARETPNSLGQAFVVMTADEAQAVIDQVDGKPPPATGAMGAV